MKWEFLRSLVSEGVEQGLEGARRVRQISAPIKSVMDEKAAQWKSLSLSSHTHLWASYLQETNPRLSRVLSRTAAAIENPYREVLGLKTIQRNETEWVAELQRPSLGSQDLDTGAILSLANFVAESFWRQFLDLEQANFRTNEQKVHCFGRPIAGALLGRQQVSESQREELFSKYRRQGNVVLPVHVEILDGRGIVVGEVDWLWQAERYQALPRPEVIQETSSSQENKEK